MLKVKLMHQKVLSTGNSLPTSSRRDDTSFQVYHSHKKWPFFLKKSFREFWFVVLGFTRLVLPLKKPNTHKTSVKTSSREKTLFESNTARFCPQPVIEYVSNATFKLTLPHRKKKKKKVMWERGKLGPVLGCLPPPLWFSLPKKHLFCTLKLTLWYDNEACTTRYRKGTC